MKQIDESAKRSCFDAVCPLPDIAPAAYLSAAQAAGITTLFVFLGEGDADAWSAYESDSLVILSPEEWDRSASITDTYLSFARIAYEERIWNLTNADELSSLVSRFSGGAEEFLSVYKEVFQNALKTSNSRIAFGLEAVAKGLGKAFCDSVVYRKTMLDLADRLIERKFAICYATGHPVCDLSSFVLRRMSERRGDILLASFAGEPDGVGQSIKKSVLSVRAAGFGGYIQYSNRERTLLPNVTQKENP